MEYLYDKQVNPGEFIEIAEGVLWLTMPLPFELDHINLYLLEGDGGWVVLDTGIGTSTTKSLWQRIFGQLNAPIVGVIVTHLHPDHVGLAGWIADTFNVPFYMTQTEYFTARAFAAGRNGATNARDRLYYQRAGLDDALIDKLTSGEGNGYSSVVSPLPISYTRLKDGMTLSLGANEWQVMIGRGHSPEHACLFNQKKNILISGDHILPIITPNIGAYSTEPDADTLEDYLSTLPQFKALPEDVIVLPAHKLPFIGLHERVDMLIAHHHEHLKALLDACEEPQTVVDLLPVMFKRKLSSRNMVFAVAECLSHLNYLHHKGVISRSVNYRGQYEFKSLEAKQLAC
ncbi:MBL fold metallo-hydrolase [Alteromonas sp. KUL106]|uniref:MBL fold metallo-hydrolase n=1 Tax=Alteromonas sp. KUL106 TaxID=2480799 RepID=UPI0012E5E9BA|nr:MBL fold metallo-hydrolase [Alteromonas sp. KUL106]GFD70445.1 Zn-dependent hydrolase [Alteromonas sp. KUL106]GFD79768.1 Zn-dependent hydrolase [Tenacibaculum sp. KUL118]